MTFLVFSNISVTKVSVTFYAYFRGHDHFMGRTGGIPEECL